MRAWAGRLPLVVLTVVAAGFLAVGVAEAWADSPTFDEPVYVSAGVAAVLHHDVTLNDEHPPLPKVLAALPVLLTHPVVPGNGRWSGNDEYAYGARFVAAQLAAGRLRWVTFASRLVPLAETAGVAFVLYAVGSELSGAVGGALAGLLWLASPFVLGIGHLDGTDIPFALAVTLSSWALLRWLRLRDARRLAWLGLALGVTADAQVTGLLVVASSLLVVVAAQWRSGVGRALARAAAAGLIAWAVVWAVYIALDPAMALQLPLLVPRPYLDGIGYLGGHDTSGSAAEQGPLGGLLRAPRHHHGRHTRRPPAARHRAVRRLRLGGRLGDVTEQREPFRARLAARLVPGERRLRTRPRGQEKRGRGKEKRRAGGRRTVPGRAPRHVRDKKKDFDFKWAGRLAGRGPSRGSRAGWGGNNPRRTCRSTAAGSARRPRRPAGRGRRRTRAGCG